jgi:NADPH:quinone reductase-like Zn-dependent oxidoreductase
MNEEKNMSKTIIASEHSETGRDGSPSRPLASARSTSASYRKPTDAETVKLQIMKAVRTHNYGGPEVLKYEDTPRPQVVAPTEMLIRVHAAGLNPVDSAIRDGQVKEIFPVKFPWIPESDVSGVVEEVGGNVTRFKTNDEVFALLNPAKGGAYAEYVVVRESDVALKPKSLQHIRAAAIPVAAITAWNALFETGQLQAGQRVLIHGGAGGVGHFAVQLSKRKGAHVIATASAKNHELIFELGADEVIDYHAQKFENVARNVDIVLDTIGSDTQERSWKVLKKGGILVSIVRPPSEEMAKAVSVRGAMLQSRPDGAKLAEIAKIFDSGNLAPVIDRILPLSEARRAQELSQSGHTRGKIVLRVVNHNEGKHQ